MQPGGTVTQTIILAAGNGSRLGSSSSGIPKPLLTVSGVPLVGHALAHARAAGCSEAVIVIGYEGARVRTAVEAMGAEMTLKFVENLEYQEPNGVSLLAAEPFAATRFFLQMVDHLFAGTALVRLAASPLGPGEAARVLVDRAPTGLDLDDATKVRLRGDRVIAIGKGLEPWDAIDAGCFLLTRDVFDALRRAPASEPRTVSSGMRQLAAREALGSADVDGTAWIDVDTPADRGLAEALLHRYREIRV
jgi:choline kinase